VFVTLAATRESRDETSTHQVDVPGVLTISVALGALVLALVEGNSWGWSSGSIIALLAASVAAMIAFASIEIRSAEPMVDFTFFRSKSFLGANLVAFIVSFAMLAMFFFLALYMQNIKGYSPLQAGVRFLPSTLMIIVVGPIAGRLTDRIGPKPLMTAGLLIVAGSMFWQGHLTPDTSYGFLVGAFVLMGIGMGLVMSPMSTAGMNAVEPTKAGVASGILSMSRMVGGTFGVAAIGALFQAITRHDIDSKLATLNIADAQREKLVEAAGSSGIGDVARQMDPEAARQIVTTVDESFIHALSTAMWLSFAVTVIGAVVAALLIERRPVHQTAQPTGLAEVAA
jgi:predicted MFS family arabinose efflux permease